MADIEPTPITDELAPELSSPFRRRHTAVPVARRRTPRLGVGLKWLAVVGIVLAALYSGYQIATRGQTAELFRLRPADDITVTGNHFVGTDEVVAAIGRTRRRRHGAEESMNAFQLSLQDDGREIASIPWVLSATVMRLYPHQLFVKIVERVPLAFINIGGHVQLVDGEGALLEKPEKATFDFPVIDGLDTADTQAERRSRLAIYEEFNRQLAGQWATSGWLLSEVNLADPDDLQALLVRGKDTVLVHFGHQDFGERFRTFLKLLPAVQKASPKIASVDLRYAGEIVVDPESP